MFDKVFSTKINVAANFVGSIWAAILGIVFVRIYLQYISIEAYGLIGVFTSIQTFIILLDFGLSPTFNREIARLSALKNKAQEMHDLKRTLETPNWIFAIIIAVLLVICSPIISNYWLQPKSLSITTVTNSLILISINVAIQFIMSFYVGGLLGLQKQVLLNVINIVCGTLRSVGAFFVLAFVSPTIEAFLIWQTIIVILQFVLILFFLNKSLPVSPSKGHFQKEVLRKIWRFAIGVTGITFVSLILTQTDKIILSRMLNLEIFGFYTLAITIANMAIMPIVSAMNNASFPKFSMFVSNDDEESLRKFYHRTCQSLSMIVIPIVSILSLFSYQILMLWIGDEKIASNTYLLMTLVVIGTGLNGLVNLPYHLQLAYGWTKLSFYVNVVAIFILVPLMIWGVYVYGAIGGAISWIVINGLSILIAVQIMHRRILKEDMMKWYFEDITIPAVVSLTIACSAKLLLSMSGSRIEILLKIMLISFLTLFFTVLSTKVGRELLRNLMTQLTFFSTKILRRS